MHAYSKEYAQTGTFFNAKTEIKVWKNDFEELTIRNSLWTEETEAEPVRSDDEQNVKAESMVAVSGKCNVKH